MIFGAILRICRAKDSASSQTNVITGMTDKGFVLFKMEMRFKE